MSRVLDSDIKILFCASKFAKKMSKMVKKVFVLVFKKWYNKTDYSYKCKWVIETFLGGLIDEK